MMINFEAIAKRELARIDFNLASWFPEGKRRGVEYVVGGLGGEPGESLSINTRTGKWSDFATGAKGGDLISLYAAMNNITQAQAAKDLGGDEAPATAVAVAAPVAEDDGWSIVSPVPEGAPAAPGHHKTYGIPDHVSYYRDRDGALLGLVYRYEATAERRKQIVSLTFQAHRDGARQWRFKSMAKPRPLYGLELLGNDGRVLIVEGEKTAEAARRMLLDDMAVVTWQGGSSAVATADWSPLAGRDCVIWPDADKVGLNAAAAVTVQLRHAGAASVVTVGLPAGVADGWDLADAEAEGWTDTRVLAQIDPVALVSDDHWEPVHDYDDAPAVASEAPQFIPLGQDAGTFFFYSSRSGQVRNFSATALQAVGGLLELAPLRYWEMNYPGKESFNKSAAGAAVLDMAFKAGIYDPERLRGRGAWLDNGRTVVHLGDRLLIDGVEHGLVLEDSRYIYENSARMHVDIGEPLSKTDANRLRALCQASPFEEADFMGNILAGWIVIAPVCGAMPWRPHLWITSEAGGGKTWIMDNIVKPLVGHVALAIQSKTTEAALRQLIGCDARPILFDEAETQNQEDKRRMQAVLDLARQASSEDGAPIAKGSQTGKATQYRVRSSFLFSSINLGLSQSADESRTVHLTLKQDGDVKRRNESFDRLKKLQSEVITREFAGRLLARTISLLPVIRENAGVFADAIARSGKSRRMGDTYGVILAGSWSLCSNDVATADEADRVVAQTPWVVKATAKEDVEPEWKRALDHLMQYRTRIVSEEIPIGELITGGQDWQKKELERMGIVLKDGAIWIANNAAGVAKVFRWTPWEHSWMATLKRTPGHKANVGSKWFSGMMRKCFSIPK